MIFDGCLYRYKLYIYIKEGEENNERQSNEVISLEKICRYNKAYRYFFSTFYYC